MGLGPPRSRMYVHPRGRMDRVLQEDCDKWVSESFSA